MLAFTALAATAWASLQVTVPPDAVRNVPLNFSASGTAPPAGPDDGTLTSDTLEVLGRPASLGPCAAEESDDPVSRGYAGFTGPTVTDPETQSPEPPTVPDGSPFSFAWTETLDASDPAGAYYMCGWLESASGAVDRVQVPFTVRVPRLTVKPVAARNARVGRRSVFTVRGTAEAPAQLDAELLAPFGYSCNASESRCARHRIRRCTAHPYDDPIPNPSNEYFYEVISRKLSAGNFNFKRRMLAQQAGHWLFCAWIEERGDSGDGLLVGPKSAKFTVRPRR